MTDPQLMKLLNFDESELHTNRNGRLSEKQKLALEKAEKSSKGCSVSLGVLLLIVALIGVGIAVSAGVPIAREDLTAGVAISVAFGCVWPLVWGGFGSVSVSRAFKTMKIEVKRADGAINIVNVVRDQYNPSTKMHSQYSVHELHVGGRTFEVESQLADIMMQGDVYALYYADFNIDDKEPEILSAEWLEKADRNS